MSGAVKLPTYFYTVNVYSVFYCLSGAVKNTVDIYSVFYCLCCLSTVYYFGSVKNTVNVVYSVLFREL